jgi:hypothetical protein
MRKGAVDPGADMRAVHILAAFAALALSISVAPAQAQDLIQAAPPADSAGPTGTPTYEDLKAEVATGLPPKAGSAIVLEPWPMEWRTPLKSKRVTTQQVTPNR